MMRMVVAAAWSIQLLHTASAMPSASRLASTSASTYSRTVQFTNIPKPTASSSSVVSTPTSDLNMATAPYFDILRRREEKFVLWIPGQSQSSQAIPPKLILGNIDNSTSPATFNQLFSGPLIPSDRKDLFELDPKGKVR